MDKTLRLPHIQYLPKGLPPYEISQTRFWWPNRSLTTSNPCYTQSTKEPTIAMETYSKKIDADITNSNHN